MDTLNETKIARLQRYLSALRKIAGWSAEDLGNLLGVTRQTIVNLENASVKMSKLQYIAIRPVLDAEAQDSHNQTLQQAISVFIDNDGISKEDRDNLRDEVNATASRVSKRKGSAAISQAILSSVIATVLVTMTPGFFAAGAIPFWAAEILRELKNRKKD